jgi:hypothetical protein
MESVLGSCIKDPDRTIQLNWPKYHTTVSLRFFFKIKNSKRFEIFYCPDISRVLLWAWAKPTLTDEIYLQFLLLKIFSDSPKNRYGLAYM